MTTKDFLSHFKGFYIKTLDDKHSKDAIPFREALAEIQTEGPPSKFSGPQLAELNSRGAGIFFTPNNFSKGLGRKAEQCEGINAWFAESDSLTKGEQMFNILASPLEPSFVVETAKSYHCYWLAKDGKVGSFREIQTRLIDFFSADPANKDCSRVLRIPGFMHMKREPFEVKVVMENQSFSYSEEQMRNAFPLKNPPAAEASLTVISRPKGETLWDVMAGASNRDMLLALSGDPIVGGERFSFRKRATGGEHILVDDKPSDAWLDANGFIGSGKKGGPSWIQWVMYYGRAKADVARWFKAKFPGSFDDSDSESIDSIIAKIQANSVKERARWGSYIMDRDATVITKGSYILVVGETSAGKTPFTLQMAVENARHGMSVQYYSLEMPNDSLLHRWARNRLGVTIEDVRSGRVPTEMIIGEIRQLDIPLLKFMSFSLNSIADLRKSVVKSRPDMIVLDNIGFVRGDQSLTENSRDKEISRALLELSRDFGITVVAIQHFRKRGGDAKKDQGMWRSMDSIAGSSKFSHDITHLVQVSRMGENASKEEKEKFFVYVQKDREYDKKGIYELEYKRGYFT